MTSNPTSPVSLNDSNFKEEVLESAQPVLVVFKSEWSGSCHIIARQVREIMQVYEGRIKLGEVDVDANEHLMREYRIRNLPTLLFFLGGTVVEYIIGIFRKKELRSKLEALIQADLSDHEPRSDSSIETLPSD